MLFTLQNILLIKKTSISQGKMNNIFLEVLEFYFFQINKAMRETEGKWIVTLRVKKMITKRSCSLYRTILFSKQVGAEVGKRDHVSRDKERNWQYTIVREFCKSNVLSICSFYRKCGKEGTYDRSVLWEIIPKCGN